MRTLDVIAMVLILIGAINWGLIGLFSFDVIAAIFGQMTAISRIIYTIVGIAGVYTIVALPSMPARWRLAAPRTETAREREREEMHV
ncbi:MAG: DUF378 domain-containing protein [Solirubrobacterales bacterium]